MKNYSRVSIGRKTKHPRAYDPILDSLLELDNQKKKIYQDGEIPTRRLDLDLAKPKRQQFHPRRTNDATPRELHWKHPPTPRGGTLQELSACTGHNCKP